MVLIGFSLLFSFLVCPTKQLINLFSGTHFNADQIDIDHSVGNAAVWALSLLSISSGCDIKIAKHGLNKRN